MAINAQFPSWLTESRIAEAQLGQQMGRNILEGLKFQEQKRQNQIEQQRYEEMAPLRTAQMQLMQAKTVQELVDAEKKKEALNVENRFNANQVEALRFQEGIARSAGNYSSPENEASFYRFLSKNPDFARTDWAKKMQDNFDLGRANAFKADQLEKSIGGKIDVAKLRFQYDAANHHQSSFDDMSNLMGEGLSPVEALDQIQKNAKGGYAGKVIIAAQGMKSQVDALKRVGVEVRPEEVLDGWNRYTAGGGALTADRNEAKNIASEDKAYVILDQASKAIDSFNKKYGEGSFDSYVGPVDSWIAKYRNMSMDPKNVPQQAKDAEAVFQKVNQVIQGYRRGQFGTALSASERDLFKGIISDREFSNYTDSIRNFRDNLGDTLKYSVGQYKLSPNVSLEIKKRWASSSQPANIPTSQPMGGQPSSGIRILGITPIQ